MPAIIRIAMWSGPRNISTAMMRSWENRADTVVVDEPFYACYLTASGVQHPMQDQVLASQPSHWQDVIEQQLSSPVAGTAAIQYQKHMTQHMVADINQTWFASLRHAFLIRHPAHVVASYGLKRGSVNAADVGFEQQFNLYQLACELSETAPPIIDSVDVLKNPERSLTALCAQLEVPFSDSMLAWPAGTRDSDGVWASHWYNSVEQSTGFAPYVEREISLSVEEQEVVEQCMPFYQHMHERRVC